MGFEASMYETTFRILETQDEHFYEKDLFSYHWALNGLGLSDVVLKKLSEKLDLEDLIIFEGWQDVSLFPSYIISSSVCISPLKRNKHHDTTYANKIFQYMAMGKPVVVSDCPPQAEVVINEKAGLVHEAENPQDLADKIFKLYSDEVLINEMGENASRAVRQKWNWENTSRDFIQMYKTIETNITKD